MRYELALLGTLERNTQSESEVPHQIPSLVTSNGSSYLWSVYLAQETKIYQNELHPNATKNRDEG